MSTVMDRPADTISRRAVLAENVPPVDHYLDESSSLDRSASGVFPASALTSPMFEGKDVAGLVAGIVITLGPLAAYSLGWGA
jgi:hypothetical protein